MYLVNIGVTAYLITSGERGVHKGVECCEIISNILNKTQQKQPKYFNTCMNILQTCYSLVNPF